MGKKYPKLTKCCCCCISLKNGCYIIAAILTVLQVLEIVYLINHSNAPIATSTCNKQTDRSKVFGKSVCQIYYKEYWPKSKGNSFPVFLQLSIGTDFLAVFCLFTGALGASGVCLYWFIITETGVLIMELINICLIDPRILIAYIPLLLFRLYSVIVAESLSRFSEHESGGNINRVYFDYRFSTTVSDQTRQDFMRQELQEYRTSVVPSSPNTIPVTRPSMGASTSAGGGGTTPASATPAWNPLG